MDPALKNLPNLKRIEVSPETFPFPDDDERAEFFRQQWSIPRERHLPRVDTKDRLSWLCEAIAGSPATIEELSHDRLPFEFFGQYPTTVSLRSAIVASLTRLSLGLDYLDMPLNMNSWHTFPNLSRCLRSAIKLEHFSLSFRGHEEVNIGMLFTSLEEHDHIFGRLRNVKLESARCPENDLVDFLIRHERSLKRVQLGGAGLRSPHDRVNGGLDLGEGTWKDLFKRISAGLDVRSGAFVAQGDMLERGRAVIILEDLEAVENLGLLVPG